jgi:DNA repair protein RadC
MTPVPLYARPPVVQQALQLLEREVREADALSSPAAVRDYLRLRLADRPHEVFAVVFLDARHRVLDMVELFRGTLTQTSVYPREGRDRGAGAQRRGRDPHPQPSSGDPGPSRADEVLTQSLKAALALVDVRVLDHFVVTRSAAFSFAERGLL